MRRKEEGLEWVRERLRGREEEKEERGKYEGISIYEIGQKRTIDE